MSGNHKRVLIVEDDEDSRDVYREVLEDSGFDVDTAVSGVEGLRRAREGLPNAILMDISVPEMDGWAVTAELGKDPRTAAIPIIVVTAYAFPEDRIRADSLNCAGFLTKPCEPSRVLAEIQRLLGG
jgi:two-component system, cell cycle response regulator DivK